MDTVTFDKNYLKQEIAPYIQMILAQYPKVSIEHRFEEVEEQHLLIVDNQTFDLPFYQLLDKILTAFYNNDTQGTLSIVNSARRQRKVVQLLPVVNTYDINTIFPEQKESTPSEELPIVQSKPTNKWSYISLGAFIAALIFTLLYLFVLNPNTDKVDIVPPSEIENSSGNSEEDTNEEESTTPNTNEEETSTDEEKIFALEKQVEEQNELIQEKEERLENLTANFPGTMTQADDLSENMVLSGSGQRIIISDIKVDNLNVDFKYQRNGQTKSGKIIIDFEIVQLNGLGTGKLFNSENGKVVMNILRPNGKVIVLREE